MSKGFTMVDNVLDELDISLAQKYIIAKIEGFQRQNKECFLTDEQLAEFCCCSVRYVKKEIKELEEMGILIRNTIFVQKGRARKLFIDECAIENIARNRTLCVCESSQGHTVPPQGHEVPFARASGAQYNINNNIINNKEIISSKEEIISVNPFYDDMDIINY